MRGRLLGMAVIMVVGLIVVPAAFVGAFRFWATRDRGPSVEATVTIEHLADRTRITQSLRPTDGRELPETVELLVPDRPQDPRPAAYDYLGVTDGSGRTLALVADPESFGQRVTVRRSAPDALTVTVEVRDAPDGAGVPGGRFEGVVVQDARIAALPPGWLCLTLNASRTLQFRRCTIEGDVLPGSDNSLGNLRWKAPGTALPTVD